MRVSQAEKDKSHLRIVEGAARLFRERGIESTGVADVMQAAGLTQGGFYRHFSSKDALLSVAIEAAFKQLQTVMEGKLRDQEKQATLADFRSYYLSKGHLANPGSACPVAMLAGDVARAGEALKNQFGEGIRRLIGAMSRLRGARKGDSEAAAYREFAMLVGAAVISRASDAETAKAVLAACRE